MKLFGMCVIFLSCLITACTAVPKSDRRDMLKADDEGLRKAQGAALCSPPPVAVTMSTPAPMLSLDFESASEPNVTYSGTVEFANGRDGKAARPTSGFVTVPGNKVLNFAAGSVAFWVKPTSSWGKTADGPMLLHTNNVNGSAFEIEWRKSGHIRALVGAHPLNHILLHPMPSGWPAGEWHHLALTWGADKIRFYVDRILVGETPRIAANFPAATAMPTEVYLLSSNRKNWVSPAAGDATMDAFRSYSTQLSQGQIDSVYFSLLALNFESASEPNVTYSGNVEFANGRVGKAARPTSGIVTVPGNKVLNFAAGSVAFWVKPTSSWGTTTDGPMLLHTNNVNGSAFEIQWRKSGHIRALIGAHPLNHTLLHPMPSGWPAGEWHHLALTWGADKIRLYVDRILVGETPRIAANFPAATAMPTEVYLLSSNRKNWVSPAAGDATMDTFRSYSTQLAPDQLEALYLEGSAPIIVESSDCLRLELLDAAYGFDVRRILDLKSPGAQLLTAASPTFSAPRLWQLRFENADGTTGYTLDSRTSAGAALSVTQLGTLTTLQWKGIPLSADTATANVSVSLEPVAGGGIGTKIKVNSTSTKWTLAEVRMRLGALRPAGSPQETHFVLPTWQTGIAHPRPFDPTQAPPQNWVMHYPSGMMTMQFFALTTTAPGKRGIYVATEDTSASLKSFQFNRANTALNPDPGIDTDIILYPENVGVAGNGFDQAFPLVIAAQQGSWYEHASRYRTFALKAPWAKAGPLATRLDVPQWMANAGLEASGQYPGVSVGIAGLLKGKNAPPNLVLFRNNGWDWANWSANPNLKDQQSLYNDSPFLAPHAYLADYHKQLHDAGVKVVGYFDPSQWDIADDHWPTLALPPAEKDSLGIPKGTVVPIPDPASGTTQWEALHGDTMVIRNRQGHPQPYAEPTPEEGVAGALTIGKLHELYGESYLSHIPKAPAGNKPWMVTADMCPSSDAWSSIVVKQLAKYATETDFDGMYLDVFPNWTPRRCYAKTHQHLPGGGSYWAAGYRRLLTQLRAEVRPKKPTAGFYGEGFSEPYMDLIDGHLLFALPHPNGIPLSMAVYHSHVQFIGRRTDSSQTEGAQLAIQAEALLWGVMPGGHWIPGGLQSGLPSVQAQALVAAQLRRKWGAYLVYGGMLAPPEARRIPAATVTGILGSAQVDNSPTQAIPEQTLSLQWSGALVPWTPRTVIGASWKAADGSVGILLVSTETPSSPTSVLRVPFGGYLPGSSAKVKVETLSQTLDLGMVPASSPLRIEVPAGGAVLIRLSP